MRLSRYVALLTLCFAMALHAGNAEARNCSESLRIEDTTSLAFGTISLPRGGGGVVILDAAGPVATVGDLSAGPGSHPGIIRLCGPANAKFTLRITPMATAESSLRGVRGDLMGNLELRAVVGRIRSAGADEWIGKLGGHGVAEIHVGGRLRLLSARPGQNLSLAFDITVLPY